MSDIKLLNSQTASNVPSSLIEGQVAINEADGVLYYRDAATGNPVALIWSGGSFTGAVQIDTGSGTAPNITAGLAFENDPDTGLAQLGGANSFSIVTNGTERVRVTSLGVVSAGGGPTTATGHAALSSQASLSIRPALRQLWGASGVESAPTNRECAVHTNVIAGSINAAFTGILSVRLPKLSGVGSHGARIEVHGTSLASGDNPEWSLGYFYNGLASYSGRGKSTLLSGDPPFRRVRVMLASPDDGFLYLFLGDTSTVWPVCDVTIDLRTTSLFRSLDLSQFLMSLLTSDTGYVLQNAVRDLTIQNIFPAIGNPAITGNATFSASSGVPVTITNTGSGNSFVVNDASADTTPFVVDASGNVIVGSGSAVGYADYSAMTLRNVNGGVITIINSSGTACGEIAVTPTATSFKTVTGQPIWFGTSNSERMRLTAAGDLGLGPNRTAPASRLDVNGVITVSATAGTSGLYLPSLCFASDPNTGFGQLATDTASIFTGGFERLRVDSSGRVGIGRTPSVSGTSLECANDIFVASGKSIFLYYTNKGAGLGTPSNNGIEFWSLSNATNYLRFRGYDSSTETFAATDIMRVVTGGTQAGNVGIQTNSPTARLDINADTLRLRTARTPASASAAGNAGDICWDADFVYICTATNTWRKARLSADGQTFTGNATFDASSGVPVTITNTGTGNSFVVNDASGDTTPFVVDAEGRVGIGISEPSNRLSVVGQFSAGSVERIPNNSGASGFYDRVEIGGGTQATKSYGSVFIYNSSNAQTHQLHSFAGTDNFINNGGKLGVNRSNPATTLDVNGVITVSATAGVAGSYLPSLTISGDPDTGFGQVASGSGNGNTASVFAGGSEIVRVNTSGVNIAHSLATVPTTLPSGTLSRPTLTSVGRAANGHCSYFHGYTSGATSGLFLSGTNAGTASISVGCTLQGSGYFVATQTSGSAISFSDGDVIFRHGSDWTVGDLVTPADVMRITPTSTFVGTGSGSSPNIVAGLGFINDQNTGIAQLDGADTWSVVTAGQERLQIDNLGAIRVGGRTSNANTSMIAPNAIGTNQAGGTFVIGGSQGTGTGAGGALSFATADQGVTSGTSLNARVTRMTILGNGRVGVGTTNPVAGFHNGNADIHTTSLDYERDFNLFFPNGVANQKVDLIWNTNDLRLFGFVEIELVSGWTNQNAFGKLKKIFSFGLNGTTLFQNDSHYTEAQGSTALNWAIGDFQYDSTLQRYKIPIAHRLATGNSIWMRVRIHSIDDAYMARMRDVSLGSIYTTDTTVYLQPEPSFPSRLAIGNNNPASFNPSFDDLVIGSGLGYHGLTIHSTTQGTISFGDTVTSGVDSYRGYLAYIHNTDYMVLGTNGAERLRIDSSGRFLQNSASATDYNAYADDLVLNSGGTQTGLTLRGTQYNTIAFADGGGSASNLRGWVQYLHDDDSLRLGAGGGVRIYIKSTGAVGIGTSDPDATEKLHVVGGTKLVGPITEGYVNNGNSGTAKTIALTNGTVQNYTLTGTCTFTMPTAVAGQSFTVLIRTGQGNYSANFTGVKWPASGTPATTQTANKMDIFTFVSDGTNWYGNAQQGYTP